MNLPSAEQSTEKVGGYVLKSTSGVVADGEESAPEKGKTGPQKAALIQIYLQKGEVKTPVMKMSRSDSRHTGVAAHAA